MTLPTTNERLHAALSELTDVDGKIAAYEETLASLKQRKNQLETGPLLELFNELGIRECVFDATGQKAKRGLVATGGLTKDPVQRPLAIEWLVGEGHEDSLNAEVVASWARGDHQKARAMFDLLKQDNGAKVTFEEGIHPATLKRIAREYITEGKEIPLTLLGVDVTSRVQFTKR